MTKTNHLGPSLRRRCAMFTGGIPSFYASIDRESPVHHAHIWYIEHDVILFGLVFLLNFRKVTRHIWNLFITWQLINIHDWAEARWFVVGSDRGAPKLPRLPSATAWWTRDQPERSSADLVIDGLAGKPRGYRMAKIAIRTRPQTKIDGKLQQQMQICCGKLKCIIMAMPHAGVCAVKRGIDIKT